MKKTTREGVQLKVSEHAENLQMQGQLLTLATKEKQDLLWKSSLFQLRSGTLKFMINASIDTLPTPANLRRWKCGTNDKLVNIALVQTLWQQRNNESHPQLLQDHVRITEIHMASQ